MLVAHVGIFAVMTLDEQQPFELEQGIAQRNSVTQEHRLPSSLRS
jgi:hypothetical protein